MANYLPGTICPLAGRNQINILMIKEGITIHISDTREAMGIAAAIATAETIRDTLGQQDEVNIVFAAAPSQNEFLAALVKQDVDWGRINAFHMDEYIGLPKDSKALFAYYLQTHLFNKVGFKTVNYINGNFATPQFECSRYTALLKQHPVDIVCMGIGENSHIAFNDPPVANFHDKDIVKIVKLDEDCRQQQVNDGCFADINSVPTHALTLTVPALLNCKYIFCIVPGERKARAIFNTFNSSVGEEYPSTALRMHKKVQLFLDKYSSSLL